MRTRGWSLGDARCGRSLWLLDGVTCTAIITRSSPGLVRATKDAKSACRGVGTEASQAAGQQVMRSRMVTGEEARAPILNICQRRRRLFWST